MPGHVSNYAITTTPTTSTGSGGEAPDKSVLYWDGTNNLIKGDSSFLYYDALKKLTLVGSTLSIQPVVWTNIVGCTAVGGTLTKTALDGWGTGGATSVAQITAGDGYVEFLAQTPSATPSKNLMCGLSNGNTDANFTDIDFAIYQDTGGYLRIYESGSVVGSPVVFTTNDVLRVAVVGGQVQYSKNGVVFYTSLVAPTYPLNVDCSIYAQGAQVISAVMNAGAVTMQEWQNSSNVVKATMNDSGVLNLAGLTASGDIISTAGVLYLPNGKLYKSGTDFYVSANPTSSQTLLLDGRFIEITTVLRPHTDQRDLGAPTLRWRTGYFGGTAASIGLITKAHASQTANLQEWQDSSGTALSIITPKGNAGLGTTSPVTRLTVKAGTAAAEAVVWENLTNATVVGDTMTCTSGATGGGNGQQIGLAGGYVEHTWNGNAAADNCMVGFATFSGRGNYTLAGTFYIYSYDASDAVIIYENGAYVTGFVGLTAGDVLRVERTAANQIKYYQNGVLKYTSVATIPQSTFYVSSQILTNGGKIKAAMVSSNAVNIQEWRDSSAAIVSRVDQSGDFFIKGLTASVVAKTTTYTVVDTDHVVKCDASGGAWTVTLPPAGANTGRLIHIKKTDASANAVTIDGNASELVEDAVTQDLLHQGENLMLQCDGTQWWVL